MANIHIFDYEDGIQDFIGQMLPYDYKSFDWDKDGFFKFDELKPGDYNIILLTKPYDCLQRGVKYGKYNEDSAKEMKKWSRRNWRYTNQEMNDEMMKFISKCNGNYICIHPDYIEDKVTELCAYLMTNQVKFKKREFNKFYKENINQR